MEICNMNRKKIPPEATLCYDNKWSDGDIGKIQLMGKAKRIAILALAGFLYILEYIFNRN